MFRQHISTQDWQVMVVTEASRCKASISIHPPFSLKASGVCENKQWAMPSGTASISSQHSDTGFLVTLKATQWCPVNMFFNLPVCTHKVSYQCHDSYVHNGSSPSPSPVDT